MVKWTAEEGLCARLLPEGTLELHKGSDISEEPLLFKWLGPLVARKDLYVVGAFYIPGTRLTPVFEGKYNLFHPVI